MSWRLLVDPKNLPGGYGFKGPGILDPSNSEKWQVATYTWTPGSMVAYEGDTVELTAFSVNGDHHSVRLVAPDGTEIEATEMNRGREYKLAFEAYRAGMPAPYGTRLSFSGSIRQGPR